MPATVIVNFMTVVHKASSGMVMVFPDVCKTPSPAGPIPIPYPNLAMSSDTANGTKTVKCDGQPIMIKSSYFMTSTGDEPGVALGVVSSKIKGKAYPKMYSFDVKADGENVFRLADIMLLNGSSPTNTPPAPEIQPPNFGMGGGQSPKKRKIKEVKWNQSEACCGDMVSFEIKTENLSGKSVAIKIAQNPGSTVASGAVVMKSEHTKNSWVTRRGPWRKKVDLQVTASGYGKSVSSGKLNVKTVSDIPEELISDPRLTPAYELKTRLDGSEYWGPTGGNYGWDMTYAIKFKKGQLIVTKKIKFDPFGVLGATFFQKALWKQEIESIWDKKWKLHRTKCKRGKNCNCSVTQGCCIFAIRIKCAFGAGHGEMVELHHGANDPDDWGGPNWWYSHTWWERHVGVPNTVRAHEFGHLIGMYDEYPEGACDPGRIYTNEPSSIMNGGSTTYVRHMMDFRSWFDVKASGLIGPTAVQRW